MNTFSSSRFVRIALTLSLLVVIVGCRGPRVATSTVNADTFTLLQLNDVYEIAALEGGKVGGMARVATLRQQLLKENPNTYTLLAGDFLSPSVIGTVKIEGERVAGAQMVDVMNAVGIDWVVFGNHEFDIKERQLMARIDESDFTWIAGNVRHQTESGTIPFTQKEDTLTRAHIVEVPRADGSQLKVGILSLCLPANEQDFVHYDEVAISAREQWEVLEPQTDFIIAITHQTIEADRDLAGWLPGLKLIIGGHEHEANYELIGDVPIAKADANAKSAYIHRITYDRLTGDVKVVSTLNQIDATLKDDPKIARRVSEWEEKAYAAFQAQGLDLSQPVTTLAEPLDGLEIHIRTRPTNLGTAIAHAMYNAYDSVDAAFFNGGSVRIDDYLSGEITEFDIVRALPFGGSLVKVDMKGSLLQKVLEIGKQNRGSGGYLQRYNLAQQGSNWTVGTQPLQPERVYSVVTSSFLLTGREKNLDFFTPDHPEILRVVEPTDTQIGRDVRLALVDYLKKQ